MGRSALNSREEVAAAITQLLIEGGNPLPATTAQFRQMVSVNRVRQRLGGGDRTNLARQIKEVEAEVVTAAGQRIAIPDLPPEVVEHMRALYQTIRASFNVEVAQVRVDAAQAVAQAASERDDRVALVDLLRTELADLRRELAARDQTIGHLRAELAGSQRQREQAEDKGRRASEALTELSRAREEDGRLHDHQMMETRNEFAGLSRRMMFETDALRRDLADQKVSLEQRLKTAERLLVEVSRDRDRLESEITRRPDVGRTRS